MNHRERTPRGLGPWPESYGVGMKQIPKPPSFYTTNIPPRDWAEQELLDMAKRRSNEGPQVRPFEYFDRIARRDARNATLKTGAFLVAAYFAAYVIWGTSWL